MRILHPYLTIYVEKAIKLVKMIYILVIYILVEYVSDNVQIECL